MAHCSVLEHHQKPTDKPSRRIKRSGGHSLVNRQVAEWIIENVLLRMLPISAHPPKQPATANSYIPFGLEPSIDARIGVKLQIPILANQIRFRAISQSR